MTQKINPVILQDYAQELGIDPLFLERDWVLTEIIYRLAETAGTDLVLKGGQALRHVYGSERLSKDVDYVAGRRLDFAELREYLTIRYPRLRLPDQPAGPTKFGLTLRPISYVGPLNVRSTVEVEISYRETVLLPPHAMAYVSPFRDPFAVTVMELDEMIAEKVRALYQRGNPRDLYDLWFLFSQQGPSISIGTVATLIPEKFKRVSGGWKRERLYDRIRAAEPTWSEGLHLLVAAPPPFTDALSIVEKALRPLIQALR
jgi:predicted nucleotidyltransferase component of viral defense system